MIPQITNPLIGHRFRFELFSVNYALCFFNCPYLYIFYTVFQIIII